MFHFEIIASQQYPTANARLATLKWSHMGNDTIAVHSESSPRIGSETRFVVLFCSSFTKKRHEARLWLTDCQPRTELVNRSMPSLPSACHKNIVRIGIEHPPLKNRSWRIIFRRQTHRLERLKPWQWAPTDLVVSKCSAQIQIQITVLSRRKFMCGA